MPPTLTHATTLRRALELVLITTAATTCAWTLASCGGKTTGEEPVNGDASISDGDDEAGSETGTTMPAECRQTGVVDGGYGSCSPVSVTVSGTAATCGFSGSPYKSGAECKAWCAFRPGATGECQFVEPNTIVCREYCAVDGRRSPDVLPCPEVGEFFALIAHNEAASVNAFALLARELSCRGAPAALLRSIARARRDEARHAARARRLSRGPIPRVRRRRIAPRSTLEIAIDNAREGCGRELYGATIGLKLASAARTPALRSYYAAIARDEIRHAALSFRIHRFLMQLLSRDEQVEVLAAMREAARASRVALPRAIASIGDGRSIARELERLIADGVC